MPAFFAKSSKWYSAMDSSFHNGHACGVRVQAPSAPGFKGFRRFRGWRLTGLRPEGCGRLMAAGCVEGLRKKVLRIDRPFRAGGFLSLTGPLAPRVADCRSAAMLIKSALRDWLSVSYDMKSILLNGSLRSPPPFRLRRTSPAGGSRTTRA